MNAGRKDTQSYKCLKVIKKLFKIEKDNKDKSYDELRKIRQKESKVYELEKRALPKSQLGTAVRYAYNQKRN